MSITVTPTMIRNASVGLYGHDSISDTSLHEGTWGVFIVVEEAVINTLTIRECNTDYSGDTLAKDDIIYGVITQIHLDSGNIRAYKLKS